MNRIFHPALLSAICLCTSANAQVVYFDILIAKNVDRTVSHYESAIGEVDRIFRKCAGLSAKLDRIHRLNTDTGAEAISSEPTRKSAMEIATSQNYNVFVVNELRVCRDVKEQAAANGQNKKNVIGCAGSGTPLTIETYSDPKREGRTMAHEFGHAVKLMKDITPGNAHSLNEKSLMFNAIRMNISTPSIASAECQRFAQVPLIYQQPSGSGGTDSALIAEVDQESDADVSSISTAPSDADQIQAVTLDLETVLEGVWDEGIPAEELERIMGEVDALARLRSVLISSTDQVKRKNAASILGSRGEKADIQVLQAAILIPQVNADPAELQRFVSEAIGSITELAVTHSDQDAANIVSALLTELAAGRSGGLPVQGLGETARLSILSGAATAALGAAPQLLDAGLVESAEALLGSESNGATPYGGDTASEARDRLINSPLNLDTNFVNEIFNVE